MSKIIELEEAISNAKRYIQAKVQETIKKGNIRNVKIDSARLTYIGETPVFSIEGTLLVKRGMMRMEERTFRVQVNATDGNLLGFSSERKKLRWG